MTGYYKVEYERHHNNMHTAKQINIKGHPDGRSQLVVSQSLKCVQLSIEALDTSEFLEY